MAYKTIVACFDKLVLALRADPVIVSNELAAASLIPPPDGQIEAQQLAQRILDIVKVEPARYEDVLNVLSKNDWLKDIVGILQTTHSEWKTYYNLVYVGQSKHGTGNDIRSYYLPVLVVCIHNSYPFTKI